jgi:hypothetical protein
LDVLATTLGDGPLDMKIHWDTPEQKEVRLDMTQPSPDPDGMRDTIQQEMRSIPSTNPRGFQDIRIDPDEMIQSQGFQYQPRMDPRNPRSPGVGFQPLQQNTNENRDERPLTFQRTFQPRGRDEDEISFDSENGETFERRDEMSEEEARVFIGYQQRQIARDHQLQPDYP